MKKEFKPQGKSTLGHPIFTQDQLRKFTDKTKKLSSGPLAVPVPGTGNDSESAHYRSVLSPNELLKDFSSVQTLFDAFQSGLSLNPDGPCLGHRPTVRDPISGDLISENYVWQSYKTVSERRLAFGSGLLYLWTKVLNKEFDQKFLLGIYAVNRPEWVIADLGCHAFGLGTVALYDTLGPETVEYVINHSELSVILTSLDKVANVLNVVDKCPNLKLIISMDGFSSQGQVAPSVPASGQVLKEWAKQKGIVLLEFSEVESIGLENKFDIRPPQATDLATVCYTSGTTGLPKGAILSHSGLIAVSRGSELIGVHLTKDDCHISYLPLAHVYERCVVTQMLIKGARIGFFRGDVLFLIDDIGALRPTIFPSVPRLLNRIHDKILAATVNSGSKVKAALFQHAFDAKVANMKSTGVLTHSIWDILVFKKIQALLGGQVRLIMSASAPVSSDVLQFLRIVFGCDVLEAYGQTESHGALSVTWNGDYDPGHVGPPIPSCEVKLVSVPEMSYTVKDKPYPRGEICVRGPIVFDGYLKDPEKTRDTLKEDGWLHTGDIGYIDHRGRIFIIDRKKNIFKLSQGEYVAPEKIENLYVKSPFISQVFVHGDSLRNELVAIVVPDPEVCIPLAKEKKWLNDSIPTPTGPQQPGKPPAAGLAELCRKPEFKKLVLDDMDRLGKTQKLRGFEFAKNIFISPEIFSVVNELLTPTFKIKRNEAKAAFEKEIVKLYQEIDQKAAASPPPAKL